MTDFVDEPPSFKERFDAIETVLAMQRARLEAIEDGQRTIKKAVGCVLLALAGQPVNVGSELLEDLGFRASPIMPASKVVVPQ
jgi:hypothetical protein